MKPVDRWFSSVIVKSMSAICFYMAFCFIELGLLTPINTSIEYAYIIHPEKQNHLQFLPFPLRDRKIRMHWGDTLVLGISRTAKYPTVVNNERMMVSPDTTEVVLTDLKRYINDSNMVTVEVSYAIPPGVATGCGYELYTRVNSNVRHNLLSYVFPFTFDLKNGLNVCIER